MPVPIRIKICGVTTVDDVQASVDAGADGIGINFHPGSLRYVRPESVEHLLRALPPLVSAVGVFVAQPLLQVRNSAQRLGLHAIQWHGENRDAIDVHPIPLIAAYRVRDRQSLDWIMTDLKRCTDAGCGPAAILVDAFVEGQEGGTGKQAPWELLADFTPGLPLILAGGLNPDNIAEAIRIVRPWGVDVASGVEASPGKKDRGKVMRFVANARAAAACL